MLNCFELGNNNCRNVAMVNLSKYVHIQCPPCVKQIPAQVTNFFIIPKFTAWMSSTSLFSSTIPAMLTPRRLPPQSYSWTGSPCGPSRSRSPQAQSWQKTYSMFHKQTLLTRLSEKLSPLLNSWTSYCSPACALSRPLVLHHEDGQETDLSFLDHLQPIISQSCPTGRTRSASPSSSQSPPNCPLTCSSYLSRLPDWRSRLPDWRSRLSD